MATQPRIYLDWNATAPLHETVRTAIAEAWADVGNPSSIHTEGRRARDRVEKARGQVAAFVGRPREQIVFTSGGTEANGLGVVALAEEARKRGLPPVVYTTAIEHPSLLGAVAALEARGFERRRFRSVEDFRFSADGGEKNGFGICAFGLVNHETGAIADAKAITWRVRATGGLVHIDAVQALGKLSLAGLDADSIALSAHKIGGPQGAGAWVTTVDGEAPVVPPGHQEKGRRPGTENVLGIIGFGAAAAATDPASWPAVAALGDRLERGLLALPGVRIHGENRVGGTINAGFSGALGQDLVMALDLAGIAASTGAACTSGTVQPSAVLMGMGYERDQALEAVRFSLGRTTTAAEIDEVLRVLPEILERARRYSGTARTT
jgi:cysteine desulfurase